MGSTGPKPITRPAGLHDLPDKLREVADWATAEQLREFVIELRAAVDRSAATDDLRPFANMVEAWWRSIRVQRDPRYEAAVREALDPSPDGLVEFDQFLAELRP